MFQTLSYPLPETSWEKRSKTFSISILIDIIKMGLVLITSTAA